jgi:hypothetical protein
MPIPPWLLAWAAWTAAAVAAFGFRYAAVVSLTLLLAWVVQSTLGWAFLALATALLLGGWQLAPAPHD